MYSTLEQYKFILKTILNKKAMIKSSLFCYVEKKLS